MDRSFMLVILESSHEHTRDLPSAGAVQRAGPRLRAGQPERANRELAQFLDAEDFTDALAIAHHIVDANRVPGPRNGKSVGLHSVQVFAQGTQ